MSENSQEMNEAMRLYLNLQAGGVHTFDPVERAKLSHQQSEYMEPFLVCAQSLVDSNGLRIFAKEMSNTWLVAQMISKMLNRDGTLKSPKEICGQFFEGYLDPTMPMPDTADTVAPRGESA